MATGPEVELAPAETEVAREPFRFSLETYRRLGELGILGREDRVELLDGILVRKMTKGPRHTLAIVDGVRFLNTALAAGWHARSEAPIEISTGPIGVSVPEPDLSVVRGLSTDYRERHPGPAEVGLVVEVADSTLLDDRRGLRRYAWAGIPTVWIVNLQAGTVEVYTEPSGPTATPGYAKRVDRTLGEPLELTLDGQAVGGLAVANFFG